MYCLFFLSCDPRLSKGHLVTDGKSSAGNIPSSMLVQDSGEPVATSSLIAWSDIAACLLRAKESGMDFSDPR